MNSERKILRTESSGVTQPTLYDLAESARNEHMLMQEKGVPVSLKITAAAAMRESGLSATELWTMARRQSTVPLAATEGPSLRSFFAKAAVSEPNPDRQPWVAAQQVIVWKAEQLINNNLR